MGKQLQEAVEELQNEKEHIEEQIQFLQTLDLTKPVNQEMWHMICDTPLRTSDDLLTLLYSIFPDAIDGKVGCNYVSFHLYDFECQIPTYHKNAIGVKMDWTYKLNKPAYFYLDTPSERMQKYFRNLDNHASWETLLDLRVSDYSNLPKFIKWILWFGKYKWKDDHRKEWEEKFEEDEQKYQKALQTYQENLKQLKKKIEIFQTKLLPTLLTFTSTVLVGNTEKTAEEFLKEIMEKNEIEPEKIGYIQD